MTRRRSWVLGALVLVVLALALAPSSRADNGFSGTTPAAGSVILAGDVTGASGSNTVGKINGTTVPSGGGLSTGNVLQASGASASTWGPLNLAGGAAYVTGSLPSTNQVSQTMGGDVSGTTASATVAKVNGSSVPAGGALTTGNVLQVSGASSTTYAAVNLAGGAGYVTGSLPASNQSAQTCAGDVTGNTGATVVSKISGTTPIAITPNELQWASAATPLLDSAATASTPAANTTIAAQRSTAATNHTDGSLIFNVGPSLGTGTVPVWQGTAGAVQVWDFYQGAIGGTTGNLCLGSTACTTANFALQGNGSSFTVVNAPSGGTLNLRINTVDQAIVSTSSLALAVPLAGSGAALKYLSTSIALTTGTVTLSTAQMAAPYLIFTGSLSGNVTLVFPSTVGATWTIDATACTLNAHTITAQANSANWATTIGVTNIYEVFYGGTGKLYGNSLTP